MNFKKGKRISTLLTFDCPNYHAFQVKVLKFILTHTFLALVTVELGHRVYRKLYTLTEGQRAEKFENHCFKTT